MHEGDFVKDLIKKRGVKQADFAMKLGVSRNQLLVILKEKRIPVKHRAKTESILNVHLPNVITETVHGKSANLDQKSLALENEALKKRIADLEEMLKISREQVAMLKEYKDKLLALLG